jgi:5-methylcytosine-specific restriction protein A
MPFLNLGRKKPRDRTVNKGLYQEIYQDKRWRLLRQIKFEENPLCECCEAKGIVTQTEEIHHKIPFQTGKTKEEIEALAFDYDNLLSDCVPCHKIQDARNRIFLITGIPIVFEIDTSPIDAIINRKREIR